MRVLGIETSCDETAAAIVTDKREILASRIFSQIAEHEAYGGVVPEIAARAHIRQLKPMLEAAFADAKLTLDDIDAVAVTAGPGLIGGVIVGVMMAKAIASYARKPFVAVNHLEGHALTARLTDDVAFPYLLLLVSGGHCQFLAVEGVGNYTLLGSTADDAMGEAFDKVAKLLGLGYPGGPAVERAALAGDEDAYKFTIPMRGREGCDFSFSGLKTAVRHEVESMGGRGKLSEQDIANLCASFQRTAMDSVADRLKRANIMFHALCPEGNTLVVAGGVAANVALKVRLLQETRAWNMKLVVPPAKLCTDNAAMIAWAGLERFRLGMEDGLDVEPRARWPLAG